MSRKVRKLNLKIYDAIGNLIYQEKSQNKKLNVDLEGVISGVCFMAIEGENSIAYKKIIPSNKNHIFLF
jgi:Secretion system C-terminal sorting domain